MKSYQSKNKKKKKPKEIISIKILRYAFFFLKIWFYRHLMTFRYVEIIFSKMFKITSVHCYEKFAHTFI